MYYLGTVDSPLFNKNKESKELRWFSIEELEKLKNIPENVRKTALHAIELANNLKEK